MRAPRWPVFNERRAQRGGAGRRLPCSLAVALLAALPFVAMSPAQAAGGAGGGAAPGATPAAASLRLEAEPVVLGRTESVAVDIRLAEPAGTEDRPLRLSTNVGSFSAATRAGPGHYRTVYVPPPTRFPQVALVAVWRETGPEAPIDFFRIALHGATKLPVSAQAGSEVRAEVGGQSFGPAFANARGQAVLTIVVPPGVRDALVEVKERGGAVTRRKVPVEVPPYNRVTAAVVPHAIVADGHSHARVEVFYDLGGADVPPDRIKVTGAAGTPAFQRASEGRYAFRFVPAAGATGKADFAVRVEGDAASSATASLALGLPDAARIVLRAPAAPLSADGRSRAKLTVLVLDAEGLGLPGQRVEVTANGQPLAAPQERGGGAYEVEWAVPAAYPAGGIVRFAAAIAGRPQVAAIQNYQLQPPPAPDRIIASFSPAPVPADGRTRATLALELLDGAGRPVQGAQVILAPSHGTLGPLSDTGTGRYEASYLPPDGLPPDDAGIRLVDAAGTFERRLELPLRSPVPGLLLGVRGGFAASLGDTSGARFGPDLWVPLRLGGTWLGLGLSATWSQQARTVADASGTFESHVEATVVPVTLRAGWEVIAGRSLSWVVGAGGVATFARFAADLPATESSSWGAGGLGFTNLGWTLGPGQLFAEASFGAAPVDAGAFSAEAGGLGLEAGYRFGLF